MPTPGRRHPASSPAAAGPPWCAGGPDANPFQPLETYGVGGGGRRGGGRPPGVLPGTTIEPCPRCPQAGHPQLPPQALESSLAAWQPDAKRRRVGEVSGGKGRLGLDPPPAALPWRPALRTIEWMPQPTRAGRLAAACCRRDGRRAGQGRRRQPPPLQAPLPQAAAAVIHEAADPCKLLSLACTVDDGPGSSLDEQTAAGSLFCIENSLEACSSLEPECDEFSVYQSPDPLSLGPEGASEAASDGCAGRGSGAEGGAVAPPPRAVLADHHLPPPPLASDPDLQEMLRQGVCAAHLLVELSGCAATLACSTRRSTAVPASLPGPAVATDRSSPAAPHPWAPATAPTSQHPRCHCFLRHTRLAAACCATQRCSCSPAALT